MQIGAVGHPEHLDIGGRRQRQAVGRHDAAGQLRALQFQRHGQRFAIDRHDVARCGDQAAVRVLRTDADLIAVAAQAEHLTRRLAAGKRHRPLVARAERIGHRQIELRRHRQSVRDRHLHVDPGLRLQLQVQVVHLTRLRQFSHARVQRTTRVVAEHLQRVRRQRHGREAELADAVGARAYPHRECIAGTQFHRLVRGRRDAVGTHDRTAHHATPAVRRHRNRFAVAPHLQAVAAEVGRAVAPVGDHDGV